MAEGIRDSFVDVRVGVLLELTEQERRSVMVLAERLYWAIHEREPFMRCVLDINHVVQTAVLRSHASEGPQRV